jgi:nifR3 family TIM-barrel protein
MNNIWQQLKETHTDQPFFVLAPMEDVTDTAFRQVIARCGRPDLFYTEFTNCEGLQSPYGRPKVIKRLTYGPNESPLIAQVWGITPEAYYESAKLVVEMGFNGLDINMGCPVRKIIKRGACSGLIKNPALAQEIVQATKEGLAGKIPLSIKTRIGFNTIDTENWCGFLLRECTPDALIVHGRTSKELSKAPNNWAEIAKVVQMRNDIDSQTVIVGNGDVLNYQQGIEIAQTYEVDGIMIGRGVFHNPWIFDPSINPTSKTPQERIDIMKYHIELFKKEWEGEKNYQILKRFYKIYIQGFEGAVEMRQQLMETNSFEEVEKLLSNMK